MKKKFQKRQNQSAENFQFSYHIFQKLMHNKTPVLNETQLREKILKGQKIPSFEPLNLHKNDTAETDCLKS